LAESGVLNPRSYEGEAKEEPKKAMPRHLGALKKLMG
jgi:hypothetical protein